MKTARSSILNGFIIGAALAAIVFGTLIAVVSSRLGHFPHNTGRILFIFCEGLFVCLLGGAVGAGVGALVRRGGRR